LIRDRGVAIRYAHALFGAALKERVQDAVLADLESLDLLYLHDPALQQFLEAPDVLTENKIEVIHQILRGRVDELVERFLLLMLRKKRVQHLPLVYERLRTLVEDHQGIMRVEVTTAVPLSAELAEALARHLIALTKKKVRLQVRVAPEILGGIIVTFGGKIIDASLRHRLQELREQLLATRVF
jgi:F-type H+-transporting ATPase subunit delta